MKSADKRIGRVQRICGVILLVLGVLVAVIDFAASDHTLTALHHAFNEACFIFLMGVFAFWQAETAGYTARIQQLEKENAALRAGASNGE